MAESADATQPAFYAKRGNRWADWWTVLHPPYTVWHLSYAALGAGLAPRLSWAMLAATVLAFFLAVGIAAHALDELHGRPLGTAIGATSLRVCAGIALLGAVIVGILAIPYSGLTLVPCIVVGVVLVMGYNLELFGGRLHKDLGFAIGWGGFPVAVGFLAQSPPLTRPATAAGAAAILAGIALSYAQRRLSTPARLIRRQISQVSGVVTLHDRSQLALDRQMLLAPLEGALRALCWAVPFLAAAVLLVHLH
ncbi:MAG TPA: hypothetical protein VGH11_18510 [Jatrophihabitans sp.]